VKDKTIAIRRKNKWNLQRFGIAKRLLNAVPDAAVVIFGLDDGERDIWLVEEDVVSAFGFSTRDELAANNAPAAGATVLAETQ
jgi:hypothetical protein